MSEFLKASTILCFHCSLLFNFQVWIVRSTQRPLMIACLCINDRSHVDAVAAGDGMGGLDFDVHLLRRLRTDVERNREYTSPPRAWMNITAQSTLPKQRSNVSSSVRLGTPAVSAA